MFANRKVWAEEPEPLLHYRQQVGDLGIGAPFQTLPQLHYNPKRLESFEQIVRSRQLPLVIEQFSNGMDVWRQVLQGSLPNQYTNRPRGIAIHNCIKINNLQEDSRFPICLCILRVRNRIGASTNASETRISRPAERRLCTGDQRPARAGRGNELAVRDKELGWFAVDDRPDFILEYRDETAWALLPTEMCQASVGKGWNRTTPQELIGVLWVVGVLK